MASSSQSTSQAVVNAQSAASSGHDLFSLIGDPLIEAVTSAVRTHMARYDGSHDFAHIRRVVGLARYLAQEETRHGTVVDTRLVLLSALLHDVGDRKYLDLVVPAEEAHLAAGYEADPSAAAVAVVLRRCGAPEDLVPAVVLVCQNVSWSSETKTAASAAAVEALAAEHRELAIVQDADRLDAIGAVGVARCFAFGAARGGPAKTGRTLDSSLEHFDEKLVKIEERMKTATGRRLARERTGRLRTYQSWFRDEAAFAIEDPMVTNSKD